MHIKKQVGFTICSTRRCWKTRCLTVGDVLQLSKSVIIYYIKLGVAGPC